MIEEIKDDSGSGPLPFGKQTVVGSTGIKERYSVRSIDGFQCKDWLLHKHYAKRIPIIIYSFGLYNEGNILSGIVTFGHPARMLMQSFKHTAMELNRLCINEGLDKNILSFFVSKAINMLPKPMILVSYADANQNHHGYIYQATNWIYTGLSSKENKVFINGKLQHRRTLNSNFGTSSVADLKKLDNVEVEVEEQEGKHRYFYFVGSKKQIKEMKKEFNYNVLPYPKGNNERYDAGYKPTVQMPLF